MSDNEEKNNDTDKDNPQLNQGGGTGIPKTLSKGENPISDSDKNPEMSHNMSTNVPESSKTTADKDSNVQSGDVTLDTFNKSLLELEKAGAEATVMVNQLLNADEGNGSGDHAAELPSNDASLPKLDNVKVGNDENNAEMLKTDIIAERDEGNKACLQKNAKIMRKKSVDTDDEIELRWDEDDDNNQDVGAKNEKFDAKNDQIFSEEQLLEDPLYTIDEVVTNESKPGEVSECTQNKLENDSSNDKMAEDIHSVEKPTDKLQTSLKPDIPEEYNDDKTIDKSSEVELLEDNEINTEGNNTKIDIPSKTTLEIEDSNLLEEELLGEFVHDTEISTTGLENEILDEKNSKNVNEPKDNPINKDNCKDEPINTETSENNLLKKIVSDKEQDEDLIDDKILEECESNSEKQASEFAVTSFTDVVLNPNTDSIIADQNVEEKKSNTVISKNVADTEASKNKDIENDDNELHEDKLLEETEEADVAETDAVMDINYERELLTDDESRNDDCTPMEIGDDEPIEDLPKMEVQITDQPIDDNDDEKIEKGLSIHQQTTEDNVDLSVNKEITNINTTTENSKDVDNVEKQVSIIEKLIDQSSEEIEKLINTIKDTVTEKNNENEVNVPENTVIEEKRQNEDKITDIIEQSIDEQGEKENPESNITDDIKTIEETIDTTASTTTVLKEPENKIVELEEIIREKPLETTLSKERVKEFTRKLEDILEGKESSKNIPVSTDQDKNLKTDEIPADNSSVYLANSPIHIKTDHGLHKPDVMLEIPSQELIDMDDTDMSFNLDQTEDFDCTNEENLDNDIVKEDINYDDGESVSKNDTVKEISVKEEAKDAVMAVDDVQIESKVEDDVKKDAIKATVEENLEKMFADIIDPATKEVAEPLATTSQTQEPIGKSSTSSTQMTPDTSDEVPEISDSLGLLAESAGRMMEDDEEPYEDDGDDDDDFDHDESSNQVSAEHSEDSNPAASESERANQDKDMDKLDINEEPLSYGINAINIKKEKIDPKVKVIENEIFKTQQGIKKDVAGESKSAGDTLFNVAFMQRRIKTEPMDIETVRLSDTSDTELEIDTPVNKEVAVMDTSNKNEQKETKEIKSPTTTKTNASPKKSPLKHPSSSPSTQSPSKMKKLEIATPEPSSVLNIVELGGSSDSEDERLEVKKGPQKPETTPIEKTPKPDADENVTNVNIPTGIEIMSSGENTSEIVMKQGEVVISGVPKPPPMKPARLNTSEVSIKTVSNTGPMVIPETKINDSTQTAKTSSCKLSLEIFNLDSDDEDSAAKAPEYERPSATSKCINYCCTSDPAAPLLSPEPAVLAYYDASRKRKAMVCVPCAEVVAKRSQRLVEGVKNLTPLLQLDMGKLSQELVEISDSESEDEEITPDEPKESIGEEGAQFLEKNLTEFLNETWKKYNMDARLKETQLMLDNEIKKLEEDSKEIDAMLDECQVATDKLRCELYATFECRRQELPALIVFDTPGAKYIGPESEAIPPFGSAEPFESRQAKRRMSSASELPAKRPAIPLGYTPLETPESKEKAAIPLPDVKMDDDKDISVVRLSAEVAPADLPPPGELSRPPLRINMPVYAMKNAFGPWLKGRVLEIQPKNPSAGIPFSVCRVKFDHKTKTNGKVLSARCIAYSEPSDVRMTIGTRLIALFKDSNKRESYYSGVVAEIPNPVNNYRYLVFFDDGYAQYVQHSDTRLVCESSVLVWEEVHPFSSDFVREYVLAYPERPMVRLHEGQHLKTEWNGKWWSSRVTKVDASLAQVMFVGDGRREWIYRGSTRLAPLYLELRAAERHRPRPMPRSKAQPRFNMPYVEYTRSDEQETNKQAETQQQQSEEFRRQRAVAKKSTAAPAPAPPPLASAHDTVTSRVVYYTPKNAVKPHKMVPHRCSPKCKRSDVLSLKELRTYNPLAKPLLSGWERQIVRFKGQKDVMYRAPCGRRLRNMRELHFYLRSIDSDLPVDLFDFHYSTHCLAEFVLNKCLVGKKDLSHGKENVPVPCVNYYDDSLPEFCSYNTERTPTAGVPLNLEPDFLCGCDCTDDCQDKSKCACWKMTLEGARTIGLEGPNVGYVYKRLPEPLPSGIYECNSRCKCKNTCLNRVAQHPLQLKLQVFKTLNRGWGIRALNDVPKGSFLCVYAGNLLTDATANLDGLNEGDEYLAELDYIEVVEQMKEGYEEDIPEADKKLDKKELGKDESDSEDDDSLSSDDDDTASKDDKEDDDFRPGYIGLGVMEFNKRLRRREKNKKDKNNEKSALDEKEKETPKEKVNDGNAEEDCITISDDEEIREPSRFMAQTGMGAGAFISKYKSVRTLFGKDEACYIMDAKVQGNIGRYLNHSCCPNVFVQNVFVDTHDPRFPWVAFFALSHIKAGTELTWNYNYDVGSVPGKVLYCFCGAPNCRGRLL